MLDTSYWHTIAWTEALAQFGHLEVHHDVGDLLAHLDGSALADAAGYSPTSG
ncbi:hypothetical protein [Kitasatospora purpeofusca]|uniref:hypothetical protein n=1 Tax=Kitasatospora purpeofusca TaxID=67352 RepID=UPI003F4ADDBE